MRKLRFKYIKSHLFRVFHVDGAVGGVTPSGGIQFSVYSERYPVPKSFKQDLNENGSLVPDAVSEMETEDGIIRELDANLVLDRQTAEGLMHWLQDKIAELDKTGDGK